MKYSSLCQVYEDLSSTTKRLKKIEILSKFLKNLSLNDREVLYFLLGKVYPENDEKKIGVSNQTIIKALSKASGVSDEKIVSKWRKIGDLGEVAEDLIKDKKQSALFGGTSLTIEKITKELRKFPEIKGKGAVGKKIDLITGLLLDAKFVEAKYLIRLLINDLRVGIYESTVRETIADAFFKEDKKKAAEKIQAAYDVCPDMALIFEKAKKGLKEFDNVDLKAGVPVKVMLAKKVGSIAEGFKTVGRPAAFEYKYDGFRLLINNDGKKIKLFTRRLDDVTKQFPDVVKYVKKYVEGRSFIIDCEIVGFDSETKKYLPFQAISQRIKRKYEIEKMVEKFPIEVNVFDVLFYNGESYLNAAFKDRTKILRKIVRQTPYKLIYAKQLITGDENKAKDFFDKALNDNQEGVMIKKLDGIYKPGSRVGFMVKLKPEHHDLDLVIVGADYGKGKRAGWLSSFILACKKGEEFVSIGKVGTGIKEKAELGVSFSELTKLLKPLIVEKYGRSVKLKPKIIVSVIYQEIQKSPTYSSGYALRFPRVVALREDKPLSDVNDLKDIEKEYSGQN